MKEQVSLPREAELAAKKLYNAWYAKKATMGRDLTQAKFAKEVGWSQSTVTQYLSGRIPLNVTALHRFCKKLDLDPNEIYPEIACEIMTPEDTLDGEIVSAIGGCSPEFKRQLLELAKSFPKENQ